MNFNSNIKDFIQLKFIIGDTTKIQLYFFCKVVLNFMIGKVKSIL